MKVVRLPGKYVREIIAHAREGRPNEVCGLIAGCDGEAVKLFRTTNNDSRPRVRYNVDPLELLNVLREIEDRGWSLMAIYHSHPMSEAYPSGTDTSLAFYPDSIYLIASLMNPLTPEVRAFRILDRQVEELDLDIVEDGTVETKPRSHQEARREGKKTKAPGREGGLNKVESKQ